jgi:hypothetical protein
MNQRRQDRRRILLQPKAPGGPKGGARFLDDVLLDSGG